MHIKIFEQCQIDILKAISPILKRYKIPKKVIREMEHILRYRKRNDDYIALLIKPVKNDTSDIINELCLCESEIEIPDNNFHPIGNENNKRIWTWFDIYIPDDNKTIFVVYPMKRKDLYKREEVRMI